MKRCALYCRVSTEEQAERFGLDSQVRSVREYAGSKQYEVQFEFSDEGYSGADLDRPGLEQLRAAIRARAINVICQPPDEHPMAKAIQKVLREKPHLKPKS